MKPGYFLIPALLVSVAALLTSVAFLGCNKGNTGKHPKISLESITTSLHANDSTGKSDSMVALFKFNNSGGTLGNGMFYSVRTRINQVPPSGITTAGPDTLTSVIPDFGGSSTGEFRYVLYGYNYLSYGGPQNDTLVFKFYALTPDSLSTDTITSPKIVVLNP